MATELLGEDKDFRPQKPLVPSEVQINLALQGMVPLSHSRKARL